MIYEYHRFNEKPDEYQYSRMYEQFIDDLAKIDKEHDIIRFDDGYKSQLHALEIAEMHGVRVVVGITTDFIGKDGYMTWDDVRSISATHIIANHSRMHEHLNDYSKNELIEELGGACMTLKREVGRWPKIYLPTYNYVTKLVEEVCKELHMEILDPVFIMYNNTKL